MSIMVIHFQENEKTSERDGKGRSKAFRTGHFQVWKKKKQF